MSPLRPVRPKGFLKLKNQYIMLIQDQLREIKSKFRLSMNGVVSQSMREKGLNYKMNFGIELPRLKDIAAGYEKNHDLAQALWKEEVRESKILAGMLQPVESFWEEIADIWVESIPYPEIAEITTMTLFQHLPYAPAKVFEWIADEREMYQLCGFLLAARLFAAGMELSERAEAEFFDQAQATIESNAYQTTKAAVLAIKKYASTSTPNANKVKQFLKNYRNEAKPHLKAIYEEISDELEYLR